MDKFSCHSVNVNIIQVNFPMSEAQDKEMKTCYVQLELIVSTLQKHEIVIVMVDFNTKVGKEDNDQDLRNVTGTYIIGNITKRGERLVQFPPKEQFFHC